MQAQKSLLSKVPAKTDSLYSIMNPPVHWLQHEPVMLCDLLPLMLAADSNTLQRLD